MQIGRNSPVLTYGVAISSVLSVLALRLLVWPALGDEVPFLFFFSAVAVTGWFGGFGPGVLSTVLSAVIVAVYFLPPYRGPRTMDGAHALHLCVYTLTGILVSWLMGKLHAARTGSETAERQMEQRALEAEAGRRTLEAMMEYIPGGLAIAGVSDGRIRKVSSYWRNRVGRQREALEGAPLESLLERRQKPRAPAGTGPRSMAGLPIVKALYGGEAITGEEWLLQRSDGSTIPVLCSAGPIRDKAGKAAESVIFWHDITELRRVEQELRQTQADLENRVRQRTVELARSNRELDEERQRLFALLNTLPFFVCLLDRRHSIRFANLRFRALFPETEEASSYAALTGRSGSCSDCPACRARESNEQVQWEWASPAGPRYEVYDNPFVSGGPDPLVLEIGVDITARKIAEQAVQREKDKLLGILSLMRESVYIVSQDNDIEFVNPAFEREFGPLVPARKCYQHLHERTEACPWCRLPDVIAGGSVVSEWESPVNDRVYDVFDAPLVNHDGSVSKLKMLHDITEHKRAVEELERRHRQLEGLWKLSRYIDVDLQGLNDRVAAELVTMTSSRCAFLGFPDADGRDVTVHSWPRHGTGAFQDANVAAGLPAAEKDAWLEAIRTRQPVIFNDRGTSLPEDAGVPRTGSGPGRLLLSPVLNDGRVILVAAVAGKEKEYTNEDVQQVSAFMAGVNAMVQKKQTEQALRESERELQRLSSELLTAQEAERLRISKELHDELGQALTLVKMRLGLVEMGLPAEQQQLKEHCESASSHVDHVIEDVRRLSRDLRPALLENLGITAALKRLVNDSAKASGIGIRADIGDLDSVEPLRAPPSDILLYRVIQETLTNIMKHSRATHVSISAKKCESRVDFQVRDNGVGMEVGEAESVRRTSRHGMGLAIMRERVRTLGGSLEISSQPGKGTTLRFSVPTHGQGGPQ